MTDYSTSSTPYTGTTTEYPYVYWPFSAISVFCFCFGTPTNLFSLAYFVEKNKHRPTYVCLLYMFMNTVDLMICLLCVPMAMTNLSGGKELFFSVSFLCSMWGYLWQILIRLSVFSVGLMSICRTISLSLPFVKLSKRHLLIPAVVYLVILMVQQSIPWWFDKSYFSWNGMCVWSIWFELKSVESKVLYIVLILLPYILPLFPIVISCLISVVKLKTDSTNCDSGLTKVGNEHAARAKKTKRSATTTIVLLTVAYIIFNVPYCLLMVDELVFSLSESKVKVIRSWFNNDSIPHHLEIYFFITVYTIPLNSTINPIIYILRIKNLRCYIRNIMYCRRGTPTQTQLFSMHTGFRTSPYAVRSQRRDVILLNRNVSSPAYLNGRSPELSCRGSPRVIRKFPTASVTKSCSDTSIWKSRSRNIEPRNLTPSPKNRAWDHMDKIYLPKSRTLTSIV